MEKFAVIKNDPNRSNVMAEVQTWIELNMTDTDPRYLLVDNRVDDLGLTVTDMMFQHKNRWAHVCPYMKDILDRELIWLEEVALPDLNLSTLEQLLRQRCDEFLPWPPAFNPLEAGHGAREPIMWKTFVVILKTDRVYDGWYPLIDEVTKVLVPELVSKGMMIGKFYPNCSEKSHFNPNWRGGQSSPAPLFVIRYLSEGDRKGFQSLPFYETYKKFFSEPIRS